jgi:hypothetical protein
MRELANIEGDEIVIRVPIVVEGAPDDLVRCECTVVALEWLRIAARLRP